MSGRWGSKIGDQWELALPSPAAEAKVQYDGDYLFNEKTGLAEVDLKVTFPPNVKSVFGLAHPYEWSIGVQTISIPVGITELSR
jgi:hypothetical protein